MSSNERSAEGHPPPTPDENLRVARPILGPRSAAVFSAFFVLVVASPVVENLRNEPRDGFPLSYYPMFSYRRGEDYTVDHLFGLDATGGRSFISFAHVGNGGHNQVRRQVRRIVSEGRAPGLCRRVARRIAPLSRYEDVEQLLVVSARYGIDPWFAGQREPIQVTIRSRCRVEREGS